ncbi:hypothetical protein MN116_003758 [Schistosoma mekongi]|uniref:Peptidylprolyl isomerase n=1 Tax=Schistosoma mekongi TaxID=38744 RepID=A0AAE2D623_SCHME|nr:hypothetical protein MN116_003758 [Schistosoma mekongi]
MLPGGKTKVILRGGTQKPCEHDRVIADVSLVVDAEMIFHNQIVTFDVGHAEDFGVMKVVDDIVQDMGCGEHCEVTLTSDYEFTDSEKSFLKISDECSHKILFNIYLQDVQKLAEFWQMSESEKFIIADVMKCRGNKLLKAGLLIRAFNCYKKAIRILDGSISVINHDCGNLASPGFESPKPTPRQLLAICLSNAAHCLFQSGTTCDINLKKSQFDYLSACIKCCKRAVNLEPNYIKAWFRMAKTHALMGNYEEAITAGEKCLSRSTDENISESKWITVDERTKTYITNKIKILLLEWRVSLTKEKEIERSIIRKRTVKKYSSFGDWCVSIFFYICKSLLNCIRIDKSK